MNNLLLNCPNCGAPVQNDICPYCGSVFLDWAAFDMTKPTFVKVKDRSGCIRLLKIIPLSISLRQDYEQSRFFADNQVYHHVVPETITIEAEFEALPFRHYLSKDKSILQLIIDPEKADEDAQREALSGIIKD